MSTEPFIGEIKLVGFNFAPAGYELCAGQTLSISQNTALFSLLGTTYGGNGITTFNLPDLRGRVPVGQGQGPGLSDVVIGEVSGTENVPILISNLPSHTHTATAPGASASTTTAPSPAVAPGPATLGAGVSKSFGTADSNLAAPTLGLTGNNIPISIMQPYLGLNYVIAIVGIFPSRN